MVQALFINNHNNIQEFEESLSLPRFRRYLDAAGADPVLAARLYQWNVLLSQALHVYLHGWEVGLRNRFNAFFIFKYSTLEWAFDSKFRRQLKHDDLRKIEETIRWQVDQSGNAIVTTASVVADLTAGIWVSFLSGRYENPYTMRGNPGDNLYRIFPKSSRTTRQDFYDRCDRIVKLRNRVAHYEPIFDMELRDLYDDLRYVVGGMSGIWRDFFDASCDFERIFLSDPRRQSWKNNLPWRLR